MQKVYGFVPVPYIRNVFADYDTNQDGTLQANELREFLKDLGEDPSPSDVESAIQAMGDPNGRVGLLPGCCWADVHVLVGT